MKGSPGHLRVELFEKVAYSYHSCFFKVYGKHIQDGYKRKRNGAVTLAYACVIYLAVVNDKSMKK